MPQKRRRKLDLPTLVLGLVLIVVFGAMNASIGYEPLVQWLSQHNLAWIFLVLYPASLFCWFFFIVYVCRRRLRAAKRSGGASVRQAGAIAGLMLLLVLLFVALDFTYPFSAIHDWLQHRNLGWLWTLACLLALVWLGSSDPFADSDDPNAAPPDTAP